MMNDYCIVELSFHTCERNMPFFNLKSRHELCDGFGEIIKVNYFLNKIK